MRVGCVLQITKFAGGSLIKLIQGQIYDLTIGVRKQGEDFVIILGLFLWNSKEFFKLFL